MSRFDLRSEGSVALITGGASGIGRASAEVFSEAGYRVLLADLDAEGGQRTAEELSRPGRQVEFAHADVADEAQVAGVVQAAMGSWGRLDVLLNNAEVSGRATSIEELDPEDLEGVLAVNLKAAFFTCKHSIPVMREQGGGSIVNVASITAETGSATYAAYGASKAGIIALTRGLARRIGRYNIRINCLSPGSVAGTNLMREYYASHPDARNRETVGLMQKIPLGRPGRPRDIAHVALFLASPLAAHLHGAVVTVDGGESLGRG